MSTDISFLSHFSTLPDPRIEGMTTYPLQECLLAALVGVLCRADDWEEVVLVADEQLDWLRQFLPFDHGIPSERTFRRVFEVLDPVAFSTCFSGWVTALCQHVTGVVAIDGKRLRGSKHDMSGGGALHLVSAFAHEAGLVLGQRSVDDKSNEITAIPELLELLSLEGAIVTIDAMGTQKDIAHAITKQQADYILALKGNQGTLHDDVRLFFQEHSQEVAWDTHQTTDGGHGRVETRTCTATSDIEWLKTRHPEWSNLTSILAIESTRYDKKYGKETTEMRYYISSLAANAESLLASVRAHWSIENNLHWSLDVAFREDENRTRTGHATENLAIVRHWAYNLLKQANDTLSLKRRRLKAALNQQYRTNLLTINN